MIGLRRHNVGGAAAPRTWGSARTSLYCAWIMRTRQPLQMVTSTAWRKLWNGLLRYLLAISFTKRQSRFLLMSSWWNSAWLINTPKHSSGSSFAGTSCRLKFHSRTRRARSSDSGAGSVTAASSSGPFGRVALSAGGTDEINASGKSRSAASLSAAGADAWSSRMMLRISLHALCIWRLVSPCGRRGGSGCPGEGAIAPDYRRRGLQMCGGPTARCAAPPTTNAAATLH